jgi:hypothetical protein
MKSVKIIEINQLSSNTRKQNSKPQWFSSVGKSQSFGVYQRYSFMGGCL